MIAKRILCVAVLLLCLPLAVLSQDEKVDLKLSMSKGQSFTITLATSNSSSAAINGKPINTTESLRFGMKFDVTEVASDGGYRLKATFNSASYSISGNSLGLDTMSGVLNKALEAINGRSFNVELSRSGAITTISGLEDVIKGVVAGFASIPEPGRGIVEALVTQGLSEANWRQGLAEIFSILPDGPVTVGERWSRAIIVGGQGMSVQGNAYLKITERGNGIAKVKVYQDIKSVDKTLPTGVSYKLSGTAEGLLEVEESTGLILRGSMKSNLKGKASGAGTGGKSVSLTITGTTTFARS